MKNMTNNTVYTVQDPHRFYDYSKYRYKSFHFHQYIHFIVELIDRLTFFYTYNFYRLNIVQYHMIYHIHNQDY